MVNINTNTLFVLTFIFGSSLAKSLRFTRGLDLSSGGGGGGGDDYNDYGGTEGANTWTPVSNVNGDPGTVPGGTEDYGIIGHIGNSGNFNLGQLHLGLLQNGIYGQGVMAHAYPLMSNSIAHDVRYQDQYSDYGKPYLGYSVTDNSNTENSDYNSGIGKAGYGGFNSFGHQSPQVYEYTKTIPVHKTVKVPVPHPVPHPVGIPVPIKIPHPYAVKIPVPIPVEKTVQVPVEKIIHYKVDKPVPVKVYKKVPYPVPKPYPVPVPVYKVKYIYHSKSKHIDD